MCVVICIISLICTNYAAKKPENKNNIKSLNACTIVLAITFNVLTISFLISDFNKITNINNAFSSKLIYMALGIGFIILGNYLPKCKRNNFIGIRTSLRYQMMIYGLRLIDLVVKSLLFLDLYLL